jgi:hypothetical protein
VRDIVQLLPSGTHKPGGSSDSKKDGKASASSKSAVDEKFASSNETDAISGVVYRMKETSITVAFEQHPGLCVNS